MSAKVVHCRRHPYDVYIGRASADLWDSKWRNPFKIGRDGTRAEVIQRFRVYLLADAKLMAALPELRGKVLGCWCAPMACHGDVLLELANKPTDDQPNQSEGAT